jgi:hypothetical protein
MLHHRTVTLHHLSCNGCGKHSDGEADEGRLYEKARDDGWCFAADDKDYCPRCTNERGYATGWLPKDAS